MNATRVRDWDAEIVSIQRALRSLPNDRYVTKKQVMVLAMLFSNGMTCKKTRENRIAIASVLLAIPVRDVCGVAFGSFKNMTGNMASMLINNMTDGNLELSDYGRQLVLRLEQRAFGARQTEIEFVTHAPNPV